MMFGRGVKSWRRRHCERSEAIHAATATPWLTLDLTTLDGFASFAMTGMGQGS